MVDETIVVVLCTAVEPRSQLWPAADLREIAYWKDLPKDVELIDYVCLLRLLCCVEKPISMNRGIVGRIF